jgi:hypothetical protein
MIVKDLTFDDLVALEPALANLLTEARAFQANSDEILCANGAWYGYGGFPGLKPRLLTLVGSGHQEGNRRLDELFAAWPGERAGNAPDSH